MKAVFGATALSLAMIVAGAAPAAADDINIYISGDEDAKVGPGPHGKGRGAEPGHGTHHRMHHDSHYGGAHHRGRLDRGRHHDRAKGWAHGSGGEGGMKRHGRGMDRVMDRRTDRVMDLVELYDRDGDGKVTQVEIDQARADRLAAFDNDGDGALSLQEYEALWLDAMRARMVDRFQSHDDDGDGSVTVEEFSERTGRMVLRGDRNGDGAISQEDMRRDMRRDMHRDMRRGHRERHRMRGGDDDDE